MFWPALFGHKGASEIGGDTENRKEFRRDSHIGDSHRTARAGEIGTAAIDRRHLHKALAPVSPIEKVEWVNDIARKPFARLVLPDTHEAVRMRVRQRPQQHPVHHAKDRRIRANTDSERSDHNRGKTGPAYEQPHAVTRILPDGGEPCCAAYIVAPPKLR